MLFNTVLLICCFLFCKFNKRLSKSSILRLFFIPFFYILLQSSFSVLNSTSIKSSIFIWALQGYILFQLINLANTSRRCMELVSLQYPILKMTQRAQNEQRVASLVFAGILNKKDGNTYDVNQNLVFYSLLSVQKFICFIKK